ncbi:hypothetical protein R5W23_002571 [Gemmata sp. JC673]|uniref:Uncharacterized protein n=1 Tax=Gemmata algarum TaxID=2975278 RepID=A0ABU5F1B1_9BACT|nr:hypothetical protein [Gemmata algarum]MDY3561294.1 hypothetical protein [Gemmata algarum]
MERRPHPDYDRTTARRVLAGAAVVGLALLGGGAAHALGAGAWAVWLGGVGFLAGCAVIVRAPLNRAPCPACGRPLAREPDATVFPCRPCGVWWATRSYGADFRDATSASQD